MRQQARFIGTTGFGFETGQVYTLLTSIHQGMFWVRREGSAGEIPYQSLPAFLANWELL